MNARETSTDPVDKQSFDRLVDGELTELERRELLLGLEAEPDGWRRCALAFLEAQCWAKEFTDFINELPPPTVLGRHIDSRKAAPPRRSSRRVVARSATFLAMTASFLVALWLGWTAQDAWRTARVPVAGSEQVAQMSAAMPRAESAVVPSPRPAPQRPSSPAGPWQLVTLTASGPGGQQERTIDLPACERRQLDAEWLESLPSALPPEVLQALERTGHRVRRVREFIPIEMQDGRRLVVPIEEIEVHYLGQPPL